MESTVVVPIHHAAVAVSTSPRLCHGRRSLIQLGLYSPIVDSASALSVFTSRYGDPIEPRNFNRYFAARCAVAGIRQITVHDARRTCATLLVDFDVQPRIVCRSFARTVRRDHGGVRVGVRLAGE